MEKLLTFCSEAVLVSLSLLGRWSEMRGQGSCHSQTNSTGTKYYYGLRINFSQGISTHMNSPQLEVASQLVEQLSSKDQSPSPHCSRMWEETLIHICICYRRVARGIPSLQSFVAITVIIPVIHHRHPLFLYKESDSCKEQNHYF